MGEERRRLSVGRSGFRACGQDDGSGQDKEAFAIRHVVRTAGQRAGAQNQRRLGPTSGTGGATSYDASRLEPSRSPLRAACGASANVDTIERQRHLFAVIVPEM